MSSRFFDKEKSHCLLHAITLFSLSKEGTKLIIFTEKKEKKTDLNSSNFSAHAGVEYDFLLYSVASDFHDKPRIMEFEKKVNGSLSVGPQMAKFSTSGTI